ncbi:Trypsinogen-like protein 3, partial [Nibea albiflora]
STSTIATLGEHDVTVEEGTEQHIQVAAIVQHSPYRSSLHNLKMVRLAEPARFTKYVQPIPLPSRCPRLGETCYVSGWGSTIPDEYGPSQQLQCITVPVVDDQTCESSLPCGIHWSPGMVCAGQANADSCMYDSGSVMVCDGQLQGVRWFDGCRDEANTTVYTKMCNYNSWINGVMDSYQPFQTTTAADINDSK